MTQLFKPFLYSLYFEQPLCCTPPPPPPPRLTLRMGIAIKLLNNEKAKVSGLLLSLQQSL